MTSFALFAALLVGVSLALLLPPLWRAQHAARTSEAEQKALNLTIFRDQLAELDKEKAEGMLSEADWQQAKSELQKRLLEEVREETPLTKNALASSRTLAIVLLLLLPVLAMTGYGILGNPAALDPAARAAVGPQMTPEQISAMVQRLANRLKENPDDMQGWMMLGRSYKSMGRYEEAAQAFAKAEPLINGDPDLLASYAETIALANGEKFSGKPRQLAERGLKIDPKHPHSLFIAGVAAMEAGEKKKAIAYWETLLTQLEPGSDTEKMIKMGLEKMRNAP